MKTVISVLAILFLVALLTDAKKRKAPKGFREPKKYPGDIKELVDKLNPPKKSARNEFDFDYWTGASSSNYEITSKRFAIPDENKRWTDGLFVRLPFDEWSKDQTALIETGLHELHQHLCVGVWIWENKNTNPPGDYVYVNKTGPSGGCGARIGKIGGRQYLDLNPNNCMKTYIIVHEMMHALGIVHEQCRPDRDEYIDIMWENITNGTDNFNWQIFKGYETYDIPYDYTSLMHYGSFDTLKNGTRVPLMLKKDGTEIVRHLKLSDLDIKKIKAMYNCNA